MLRVKVYKEVALPLPQDLKPDSLYFIENGNFAETYFTDKNGVARQVGNSIMISAVSATVGDKNYVHSQGLANSIWTINHKLGKLPSVTVLDTAGTEVIGNVMMVDDNNIIIVFNSSFSGTATLN